MVTALLAERAGVRFKAHRSGNDIAEGRLAEVPVTLARPRSYMNLSGRPVAALAAFYKIPPDRLVVIHDELDIPFGALRLKFGGGDNGHNGLRSITQALGTRDYYRVRFGIGRPPGRMEAAVYVLRDFSPAERKDLPLFIDRCADATETLISKGLADAQNIYHTDWPEELSPMTGDDHALARDLAEQAGQRLVELRAHGGDPDVLRKAGDRLSHEFLTRELADRRPGDVVLSEEGADNPARLDARRVWIVDPLDGTREFGEPGRTDWAVHVALWERSDGSGPGDLTAGAVALPAQGKVLSTAAGERQQCSIDAAITTSMFHRGREGAPDGGTGLAGGDGGASGRPGGAGGASGRIRIVVSRTRAPQFVRNISDLIDAELVPLGSAGAKVAAVVGGEVDAYVHGGGFYEWDTAAPVAVARAAGFHASRIDSSALAYNQADLLMPDILVCRPAVAGVLLQAIREVTNAS